jgi:hypothetical protein
MKLQHALPLAAIALATAVVPAAQAQQGSDKTARAQFIGAVHIAKNGSAATLRVRYRCSAGDTLWVSAKQSATAKRDPKLTKEGSSKISAAWLQSHRNKIACDGAFHTTDFKLDKVEPGSKGKLAKGKAYVQFCVTANQKDLTLSKSGWVSSR